jgi:hypothetical protein
MLRQNLLEIPTRVTGGMVRHLSWGAARRDLTALVAAFGTQIDDPVRAADHVEVVLDHPHNSNPSPANAAALLRHEDAATSAAGALDDDSRGSDATAE